MTLYQFKLLPATEQMEIIFMAGVYLGERKDGDYTYKLYQIDAFYVEEEWHTKFNVRRGYISFISEEKLKPYLEKIDLSALNLRSSNDR